MDTIYIKRGNKVVLPITFEDNDGNRINITGGTVVFTVKKTGAASNALQKVITTFTNPSQGECEITLDTTDTSSLSEGEYCYEIKLTTSTIVENTDLGVVKVNTPLA